MSMFSYCSFMYLHCASWHSSATLTEVSPCSFVSCKENARVKPAKTVHGTHCSKNFVLFYVLCLRVCVCVCKCVLYYCNRVATQLSFNKYIVSIRKIFEYGYFNVCPSVCFAISHIFLPQHLSWTNREPEEFLR